MPSQRASLLQGTLDLLILKALASSELQRLIETYRGTDAATEAVITLNQVRMVNGQSELAALLAEYGRRSALHGGNPYRSKAYIRAAENLAALAEPLERLVDQGRLQEIRARPDHLWRIP